MDMPPEVRIGLISAGVVITIAILLLVFGDRPELAAAIRRRLAGHTSDDMSSDAPDPPSREAGDERVPHQVSGPAPVRVEPNPDDTEPVPGATGAGAIDTNARDIIRASLIAELLDSGLLTNRDKAICQAFRCSKASSSRPDAPFQVALRLVEQHRAKARPEYVGEMIERVEREVAGESR